MAYAGRTYTVQELINRALRKADMENSEFISSDEALDLFNESYTEMYDLLVTAFENYYIKDDYVLTLIPGTQQYDLPTDFYKSVGVDFIINSISGQYLTLRPFLEAERNGLVGTVSTTPTGSIRMRYVPLPKRYIDTSDTVDGLSGYETLVVIMMAISMRSKEESDTTDLERQAAKIMKRIEIASQNRDIGFPAKVVDIQRIDIYQQYSSIRYQLTGSFIKFLTTEIVGAPYLGIY